MDVKNKCQLQKKNKKLTRGIDYIRYDRIVEDFRRGEFRISPVFPKGIEVIIEKIDLEGKE